MSIEISLWHTIFVGLHLHVYIYIYIYIYSLYVSLSVPHSLCPSISLSFSFSLSLSLYIYIYTLIYMHHNLPKPYWVECSPMSSETGVPSEVESYQRLKKWYLMLPCLTLSIIRYGSRVKWSNPGKWVAASSPLHLGVGANEKGINIYAYTEYIDRPLFSLYI